MKNARGRQRVLVVHLVQLLETLEVFFFPGKGLDHADPGGRSIDLAVVRRKATGPGKRV